MKVEEILTLIKEIDRSTLAYVDYHHKDIHLTLSKEMPEFAKDTVPKITNLVEEESNKKSDLPDQSSPPVDQPQEDIEVREVTAPLIGVAYLQPKPDDPPFIQVGDHVNKGDVIMILEAMKLMNEIQSTETGIVTEILVSNEEVVEYGQPLIRVK